MNAKSAAIGLLLVVLLGVTSCVPIPPSAASPAPAELAAGAEQRGAREPTNTPTATPTATATPTTTPTATPTTTATVTPVVVLDMEIEKDANTALTRTYRWTIDKASNPEGLTLPLGQTAEVSYAVVVALDGQPVDGGWVVTGTITVTNASPVAVTLAGITDIITPDLAAEVDCGVDFPYMMEAGETLLCTYIAQLPDGTDRVNRAMATLGDIAPLTRQGVSDFAGTADVRFAGATVNTVDECINVTDSFAGPLGTVCAGTDTLPRTFSHRRTLGPYTTCGTYEVETSAAFASAAVRAMGSVVHTLMVEVPCADCTLGQGYWRTHSRYGPAQRDDAWALIGPNGEDTPFFLSGLSYYQVLWTEPQGNAYFTLAHHYIAARLNRLRGVASTPEVDAALTWAGNFFNASAPLPAPGGDRREQALAAATTLDEYNNGELGPGSCDD